MTLEQCNIVHILRSGKQVDNQVFNAPIFNLPVSNPLVTAQLVSNDPSSSSNSQPSTSKSDEKDKSAEQTYKPIVPYLYRLANTKTNTQMEKIREMFNQVQINVPLLDAIQQVPTYAKFLKDMCTKKRKINVPKKVLASNISESPGPSCKIQRPRMSNPFMYHRTDHQKLVTA